MAEATSSLACLGRDHFQVKLSPSDFVPTLTIMADVEAKRRLFKPLHQGQAKQEPDLEACRKIFGDTVSKVDYVPGDAKAFFKLQFMDLDAVRAATTALSESPSSPLRVLALPQSCLPPPRTDARAVFQETRLQIENVHALSSAQAVAWVETFVCQVAGTEARRCLQLGSVAWPAERRGRGSQQVFTVVISTLTTTQAKGVCFGLHGLEQPNKLKILVRGNGKLAFCGSWGPRARWQLQELYGCALQEM